MADTKISGLTAKTAAGTGDLIEIVDVSDTTMAATGTNKKITFGQFLATPGSIAGVTVDSTTNKPVTAATLAGGTLPASHTTVSAGNASQGTTTLGGASGYPVTIQGRSGDSIALTKYTTSSGAAIAGSAGFNSGGQFDINVGASETNIVRATTTGLAVTGALSATSVAATSETITGSTGALALVNNSAASNIWLKIDNTSLAGGKKWRIGDGMNAAGTFYIYNETDNSFPIAISTAGVAVTGALSATSGYNGTVGATTPAAGSFTTLSATGAGSFNSSYSATATKIFCDNAASVGAVAWFRKYVDISGSSVDGVGIDALNGASSGNVPIAIRGSLIKLLGDTVVTGALSASTTGKVGTTLGVGNATPAASGAGISFPATQSASTDPNTLDDYKEGTWTPAVTSGAGTITSVTNKVGTFTKSGRLFTVFAEWDITDNGTGSSTLNVGSLPYTPDGSVLTYRPAFGRNRSQGCFGGEWSTGTSTINCLLIATNAYPAASGQHMYLSFSAEA